AQDGLLCVDGSFTGLSFASLADLASLTAFFKNTTTHSFDLPPQVPAASRVHLDSLHAYLHVRPTPAWSFVSGFLSLDTADWSPIPGVITLNGLSAQFGADFSTATPHVDFLLAASATVLNGISLTASITVPDLELTASAALEGGSSSTISNFASPYTAGLPLSHVAPAAIQFTTNLITHDYAFTATLGPQSLWTLPHTRFSPLALTAEGNGTTISDVILTGQLEAFGLTLSAYAAHSQNWSPLGATLSVPIGPPGSGKSLDITGTVDTSDGFTLHATAQTTDDTGTGTGLADILTGFGLDTSTALNALKINDIKLDYHKETDAGGTDHHSFSLSGQTSHGITAAALFCETGPGTYLWTAQIYLPVQADLSALPVIGHQPPDGTISINSISVLYIPQDLTPGQIDLLNTAQHKLNSQIPPLPPNGLKNGPQIAGSLQVLTDHRFLTASTP
ncbi:hypothetical protein ACFVX9_39640, partial [Kitasatospora sp. NPDC058243]|uniref:hypothetical protein n=1 Tax=Kitasatospora sp. NPDC058243 TaxID=3346397 RepID=UPI0036DE1780